MKESCKLMFVLRLPWGVVGSAAQHKGLKDKYDSNQPMRIMAYIAPLDLRLLDRGVWQWLQEAQDIF